MTCDCDNFKFRILNKYTFISFIYPQSNHKHSTLCSTFIAQFYLEDYKYKKLFLKSWKITKYYLIDWIFTGHMDNFINIKYDNTLFLFINW